MTKPLLYLKNKALVLQDDWISGQDYTFTVAGDPSLLYLQEFHSTIQIPWFECIMLIPQ